MILVLGTDPLHSSPILDLRIRKAIRRNGARLAVATERPTALDGGAEAIARYAPGEATHFVAELAAALGGAENVATPLAETLRDAGKVVVVWGERIGREGDGAARGLLERGRRARASTATDGAGLLEVPDTANARGLREAGCLPDAGPGLSEPPPATVAAPRRSAPALSRGELDGLILFGVDPLRDFPDTEAWEEALTAADFVVSFSTFETATTAKADVLFPLETHAEKDGTVTHPDGRLQRVRPAAARPGDIRPELAGPRRPLPGARPRHRRHLPAHRLRRPDRRGPLLRRITDATSAAAASAGRRPSRLEPRRRPAGAQRARPPALGSAAPPDTRRDGASADPVPAPTARDRRLALGHLPRPLGRPDHRAESAAEVPRRPTSASRSRSPTPSASGSRTATRSRSPRTASSVEATVAIQERVAEGVCFLAEGIADGNANALLNGGPVRVEIEKLERGPGVTLLPFADTQFVEATWIMIVKSIVIFAVIFGILPILTVVERKLIGRFQHRYGPNRVGPFGLLQPLADVGKLISKESFRPANAISTLFILGPLLPVLSGVLALAIIPWGDVQDGVGLYGIDVPIGILYFFAVGSIAFYGLLLGGWSSGSKYSLLGAMRSAAQLISYEVSMGLALLGVIMMSGSLSLVDVVQRPGRRLVHRPPVRRLPDLHAGRLRRDQPHPVRHARGRRRAGPGLHDRVRRHALRLLPAGRIHGDPGRLRDRRGDVPRRLDGPRPGLARPDLDAGRRCSPWSSSSSGCGRRCRGCDMTS